MISDLVALIGVCKCKHMWLIRKKVPIYCPKCHRRTTEHTTFFTIQERIAENETVSLEPKGAKAHRLKHGCKPGDLVEDILIRELPADWNIPKQEGKPLPNLKGASNLPE